MRLRYALFGALSLVVCVFFVLLAASVPWSSPYQPQQRRDFAGADFQLVMGSGLAGADGLQVGAVGSERVALQALPLAEPLDADAFPILRYQFADFPRTLELSLVFRREADPDDVQVVSLPWPAAGKSAFNLTDVPGWRGRIIELGFSQQATPQLIPSGIPFAPFRLINAQLWSPSWRGGLAALLQDWSAYRPWGFFSVSSIDQDAGLSLPRRPALLLLVQASIVTVAGLGLLLFGWRRRSLRWALAIAFAMGWLLLDAIWVGQLYERRITTREVYAGKSWPERATLVPDDELLKAAARIREVAATTSPPPHVLIHASSPVEMNRLQYLALPVNAGLLVYAINPMSYNFPAGTLLVLYAMDEWRYDESSRQLRMDKLAFPVTPVIDEGALRIYRIESVEAPQ